MNESIDDHSSLAKRAQCRYFISELDHMQPNNSDRQSIIQLKDWLREMENEMMHEGVAVHSDRHYPNVASPRLSHIPFKPETENYDFEKEELRRQVQSLTESYNKEMAMRKKLFNEVAEMKGNIRVFCRIRPLQNRETDASIDVSSDNTEIIADKKRFQFNTVFPPSSSQSQVFEEIKPVVQSVIDGYNACIFAYGQTGSGKTHTMEGTESDPGVDLRALKELFRICDERTNTNTFSFSIKMSVFEIYNETIRDLLVADDRGKLEIRKHNSQDGLQGVYIEGLSSTAIETIEEAKRVIQTGRSNRAIASTNSNEHSSRSHCLVLVQVLSTNLQTNEKTRSKLYMIDLAGSERLSKSQAQGAQLIETKHINKSLASLGQVMSALLAKQAHIPYRDSKLTYLLQDSFGGNSKVAMIIQISPASVHSSESLCTLSFASRVQSIQLGQAKKNVVRNYEDEINRLMKFKEQSAKDQEEIKSKDAELAGLKDKLTTAEEKIAKLENLNQQLMEKIRKKDKEEEKRKKKEESKKLKKADKENVADNKEAEEKKPEKTPRKRLQEEITATVTPVAKRVQVLREGAPRSSTKKIKISSDSESPPPSYQSLFSPVRMEFPEVPKKTPSKTTNPLLTLSSSLKKKKQIVS